MRQTLVAIGVLVALVAAACGGGGDEDGGGLSRDELLARGDEICGEAGDRFAAAREDAPGSAEEAAELAGELIEVSEDELARMRELDAPEGLDRPLERYLDAKQKALELLRKGRKAAERNDAFAYADAQAKIASKQVRRLELARAVGFEECSRLRSEAPELDDQGG